MDLDRITNPLRLAGGSHEPGSGKGCAMNVISYINGDVRITDYPKCSARPLAAIVQLVNDILAGPNEYLSPKDAVVALDLGWMTVGTAGATRAQKAAWLADAMIDPTWGMFRHGELCDGPTLVVRAAELLGSWVDHNKPEAGVLADELLSRANHNFPMSTILEYAARMLREVASEAPEEMFDYFVQSVAVNTTISGEGMAARARLAIQSWRDHMHLDDTAIDYTALDDALGVMAK